MSTQKWVDWAQSHPRFSAAKYIEVDAEDEIIRTVPPKTVASDCHIQFSREKQATRPATFVAIVPQGRVWEDYGAIITPDNQLLRELSVCRRIKARGGVHSVFWDWRLCPLRQEQGRVAVLSTDSTHVYYHWLFDLILRYAVLEKAGFGLDNVDKFVIGSHQKRYQKETLNVLGLDENRLIDASLHPHIQAEQLVVPSYPTISGQFRKWHLDFLRSSFLPGKIPENLEIYSRIYISRGQANYRRVLNEPDVIALLSEVGFRVVKLESFSFSEQVALMNSAEAIVAPHGSGLANIAFCQAGTKVIEIFSPELLALFYWRISDILKLDYYYVLGKHQESYKTEQSWDSHADIDVPIDKLKSTLELAGLC